MSRRLGRFFGKEDNTRCYDSAQIQGAGDQRSISCNACPRPKVAADRTGRNEVGGTMAAAKAAAAADVDDCADGASATRSLASAWSSSARLTATGTFGAVELSGELLCTTPLTRVKARRSSLASASTELSSAADAENSEYAGSGLAAGRCREAVKVLAFECGVDCWLSGGGGGGGGGGGDSASLSCAKT